jgi:DNA-binding transcriptional regulator YiaG
VIERALTQSELLSIWERGEGQRPSGRALALLSTAADDELASLPVGCR